MAIRDIQPVAWALDGQKAGSKPHVPYPKFGTAV